MKAPTPTLMALWAGQLNGEVSIITNLAIHELNYDTMTVMSQCLSLAKSNIEAMQRQIEESRGKQ